MIIAMFSWSEACDVLPLNNMNLHTMTIIIIANAVPHMSTQTNNPADQVLMTHGLILVETLLRAIPPRQDAGILVTRPGHAAQLVVIGDILHRIMCQAGPDLFVVTGAHEQGHGVPGTHQSWLVTTHGVTVPVSQLIGVLGLSHSLKTYFI